MTTSIFVLGEALMDCIAQPDGRLLPLMGGSPFNLARTAFAAQLTHSFDQGKNTVHTGVHTRQATAVGVDRQMPTGGNASAADKGTALAFGAKT